MGYAPDWNKGSMKKSGSTPVTQRVTSRELFHGAKTVQKFADGGDVELNIRGEKVGKYEGNDEIAKYRMNMTDDVGGKSLRLKDQTIAPDFEGDMSAGGVKASNVSDDPKDKFIAEQVKNSSRGSSSPKQASKNFAQKAAEAKPYDPEATSAGMGTYMAKDLGLADRAANFTAAGDYVSATDVAAADFMKRSTKKAKK